MSTASNAAGYQPSKKSQTGGQLSWLERLTPRKAPSRYSRTVAASSPPHALTFDDPIPGDGRGSSRHWQRHDSSTAIQDRDLRDCTRLKTAKSWNDPTWVGTVTYAQDAGPTKSILACYLCLPDKASQPASQPGSRGGRAGGSPGSRRVVDRAARHQQAGLGKGLHGDDLTPLAPLCTCRLQSIKSGLPGLPFLPNSQTLLCTLLPRVARCFPVCILCVRSSNQLSADSSISSMAYLGRLDWESGRLARRMQPLRAGKVGKVWSRRSID